MGMLMVSEETEGIQIEPWTLYAWLKSRRKRGCSPREALVGASAIGRHKTLLTRSLGTCAKWPASVVGGHTGTAALGVEAFIWTRHWGRQEASTRRVVRVAVLQNMYTI